MEERKDILTQKDSVNDVLEAVNPPKSYASGFIVGTNLADFNLIPFWDNVPTSMITTSPTALKSLHETLGNVIKAYEEINGKINTISDLIKIKDKHKNGER